MCAYRHWHTPKAKEWSLSSSMQLHCQEHNTVNIPFWWQCQLKLEFYNNYQKQATGFLVRLISTMSVVYYYHVKSNICNSLYILYC